MRYWGRVIAALAVAGCSSSTPNAERITGQNTLAFASVASEEAPPLVFNTQMRSDIEVPAARRSRRDTRRSRFCRMAPSSRSSSSTTKGMRASASATSII